MTPLEIEAALAAAIQQVMERDRFLLEIWKPAHERSVLHRLAVYLEQDPRFSTYHVDCEYHRQGVLGRSKPGATQKPRYPDLIIHRRGDDEHNLLVIEAKYSHRNPAEIEDDLNKLDDVALNYRYQHAYFLKLVARGPDRAFDPAITFARRPTLAAE